MSPGEFAEFLNMGGDLSAMALLYIAWRFDKRLSHLEWLEKNRKVCSNFVPQPET